MKRLGLYLHIPFCKTKCLYCDFCSFGHPNAQDMERYVKALCSNLQTRSADCRAYAVDTVYFGGGTPTLLPAAALAEILETVAKHYRLERAAEITAECNPATAQTESLRVMRKSGFNRLSIGIQSAQARELKALGRLHSFADACRTWDAATDAGFSNLSADVMFGIPHQTKESFLNTLEKITALNPKHLSMYALAIEEGTPFGRRGEEALDLPQEDTVREMYLEGVSYLEAQGLSRYEISNFAKRGYESRHNLKYWNTDEYLGFGLSAHSDFGGVRFANGNDLSLYLSGADIVQASEKPSQKERMNEYIMLRMRLREGIRMDAFADLYGKEAALDLEKRMRPYLAGGFIKTDGTRFWFESEGMLVSNAVLSELLDFS